MYLPVLPASPIDYSVISGGPARSQLSAAARLCEVTRVFPPPPFPHTLSYASALNMRDGVCLRGVSVCTHDLCVCLLTSHDLCVCLLALHDLCVCLLTLHDLCVCLLATHDLCACLLASHGLCVCLLTSHDLCVCLLTSHDLCVCRLASHDLCVCLLASHDLCACPHTRPVDLRGAAPHSAAHKDGAGEASD